MVLYVFFLHHHACGKQHNSPQTVHALIPSLCEYDPLHGKKIKKKDFVEVMKLRLLRRRDYPGLSG